MISPNKKLIKTDLEWNKKTPPYFYNILVNKKTELNSVF